MRLVGRVVDWNDDKGYGFVVPHDGGLRAFVHVKAFQFGSRRPVNGDLISYDLAKDSRGRTNAINVRFAGQRIERRTPRKAVPIPRTVLGMVFLFAVLVGTVFGRVPALLTIDYWVLSTASYLVYWWDKEAAGKGAQRTPESTLHFADLLGGWPGALIAQQQFRHKTVKASFQAEFWITVLANLAAAFWLLHSGTARVLTHMVLGT
jgi:uncharacterized membrane protein YsdA (DUF1294 family)/cold shock CspA family protein